MFLRQSKNASGKIFLSICKAYRDENGKSRQKTVKKIGYLDDIKSFTMIRLLISNRLLKI
jgi:hypothetical protein